jgi:hypothetical protein
VTVRYAGLDGVPLKHAYQTVTYIEWQTRCIDTINSPDDEHMSARTMYRIGINIYEKRIARQVGYLQELYWDSQSTKHKKIHSIHNVFTLITGQKNSEK